MHATKFLFGSLHIVKLTTRLPNNSTSYHYENNVKLFKDSYMFNHILGISGSGMRYCVVSFTDENAVAVVPIDSVTNPNIPKDTNATCYWPNAKGDAIIKMVRFAVAPDQGWKEYECLVLQIYREYSLSF